MLYADVINFFVIKKCQNIRKIDKNRFYNGDNLTSREISVTFDMIKIPFE